VSTSDALVGLQRTYEVGTPEPPSRRARLLARVLGVALDHQLASGVPPWRSPIHAARGVQLTSPRRRGALARSLEQLIARAESPAPRVSSAIPPCVDQVRAARAQILLLSAKLRSGSPADCRGVAKLRRLLSDGAGPCYLPTNPTALAYALDDVSRWLDAMD
jgi:hypothetical protein